MNNPCQATTTAMTKSDTTTGMTYDPNPEDVLQGKSDKYLLTESKTLDENCKLAQTGPVLPAPPSLICPSENDDFPTRSCFPCHCRRGNPVFGGNKEALAWAVDNCASIVSYVGTGAFLGTVRSLVLACNHVCLLFR